jgi:hypothetical protein
MSFTLCHFSPQFKETPRIVSDTNKLENEVEIQLVVFFRLYFKLGGFQPY